MCKIDVIIFCGLVGLPCSTFSSGESSACPSKTEGECLWVHCRAPLRSSGWMRRTRREWQSRTVAATPGWRSSCHPDRSWSMRSSRPGVEGWELGRRGWRRDRSIISVRGNEDGSPHVLRRPRLASRYGNEPVTAFFCG